MRGRCCRERAGENSKAMWRNPELGDGSRWGIAVRACPIVGAKKRPGKGRPASFVS